MSSAAIATLLTWVRGRCRHCRERRRPDRTRGDWAHFQASACSRPPPPTIRTFIESRIQWRKCRVAGEHHGDAVLVGRGDHFRVALRASRLDDGLDAEIGDDVQSIAKRKERIGRRRRRFQRQAFVLRLHGRDLAAHHAAHLSCTYPECCFVLGANDGIRFDIFRNAPGEQKIARVSAAVGARW